MNNTIEAWTGTCCANYKTTTKNANEFTKEYGIYYTAIKATPKDENYPTICWVLTNKFDPRARS